MSLDDEPAGTVYRTSLAFLEGSEICQSEAKRLFPGCFIVAFGTEIAQRS